MTHLHIGKTVWIVTPIWHKPTDRMAGATVDAFLVVSFDKNTASVVHKDRDTERNILDLISLRFVGIGECFDTQEEAEVKRAELLIADKKKRKRAE
jgi:hypothetical protein